MYADPVTGRRYATAAALAAVRAQRQHQLADIAHWSYGRGREAELQAELEAAQWQGFSLRSAVLLTPAASGRILRTTRTRDGLVQLDGLLVKITGLQADVMVWFFGAPQTELHTLQRSEIERPLGHPFTIWDRKHPLTSAHTRQARYAPEKPKANLPPALQFWSE